MSAGTYNFCINQYATFSKVFVWTSGGACCCTPPVGSAPGPVDLTGYTAALQIRPFVQSADILYDATPDLVLGGVNGTISLTISAADTGSFTWPSGVYDLIMTDSSGIATRLLQGSVTVSPGVTP